MKRIIKYIFILIITLIPLFKVNALSLSKSSLTIEVGKSDTVELYANVGEEKVKTLEFELVFYSYDIPVNFRVNSAFTDVSGSTTHKISFGEEGVNGNIHLGTVNAKVEDFAKVNASSAKLKNAKAITVDDKIVQLNEQTLNVTVLSPTLTPEQDPVQPPASSSKKEEPVASSSSKKEEPVPSSSSKKEEKQEEPKKEEEVVTTIGKIDEGLLEKIDSEIVNIKLIENVYEYTVYIDKEEVTELDLKPVAIDETTKIFIKTQKISELENNIIAINVTKDEIEQTYLITVKDLSEMSSIQNIEIDNAEFKGDNSYKAKWLIMIAVLIIVLVTSMFVFKKK